MKNIIIIGLGKMGNAHLNSFLNQRLKDNIIIVEKNSHKRKRAIKHLKKKYLNFEVLSKIPKNKIFELAVVSTPPNNRLQIIKELANNNKIKNFLLEKFLFNRFKEFKEFSQINSKLKINTYVNVWSKKFLQLIRLKKNLGKVEIKITLPQKKVLTNLIHFYEMFKLLTNRNIKIDLSNFELRKINKSYFDGNGIITLKNKEYSMQLKSIKMPNKIIVVVKKNNFVNKKIYVSKGKIIIYSNSIKKIKDFPLASRETYKFYRKILINKRSTSSFSNYNSIANSSVSILKSFKEQKKKEIKIF